MTTLSMICMIVTASVALLAVALLVVVLLRLDRVSARSCEDGHVELLLRLFALKEKEWAAAQSSEEERRQAFSALEKERAELEKALEKHLRQEKDDAARVAELQARAEQLVAEAEAMEVCAEELKKQTARDAHRIAELEATLAEKEQAEAAEKAKKQAAPAEDELYAKLKQEIRTLRKTMTAAVKTLEEAAGGDNADYLNQQLEEAANALRDGMRKED